VGICFVRKLFLELPDKWYVTLKYLVLTFRCRAHRGRVRSFPPYAAEVLEVRGHLLLVLPHRHPYRNQVRRP
jgi:hypothetical protein